MEILSHLLFATNLRLFGFTRVDFYFFNIFGDKIYIYIYSKVSVLEKKIYDIRIK